MELNTLPPARNFVFAVFFIDFLLPINASRRIIPVADSRAAPSTRLDEHLICMPISRVANRNPIRIPLAWETDPDWQAFQRLCYSDTEAPDTVTIRKGVHHLITAAQNGHASAQCRLATELHLGEGRLGIKPDVRKAVAWYREAAKNGDPIAIQSLVVLTVTQPEVME